MTDGDAALGGGLTEEGLHIELADGAGISFSPGSRTALVGEDTGVLLAQLSDRPGVALLLADAAGPLHPSYSIGRQISDASAGTRRAALDLATDLLEATGIAEPHDRVRARPHQLTALDRQRAQLALALANGPDLLLAHDPAGGLSGADAAAFASAVRRLWEKLGYTLVVAAAQERTVLRLVDEILVVSAGRVVERRRRV